MSAEDWRTVLDTDVCETIFTVTRVNAKMRGIGGKEVKYNEMDLLILNILKGLSSHTKFGR
jgi:hypothetical protein